MSLTIRPITFKDACAYIRDVHRHHLPPQGHKFSISVTKEDGVLCGVATIGRPVGRGYDDGVTCEVTRVATDGTPNACSMLYRAAWRAAKAMGYTRLVTYTLSSEEGTSCRAAGMRMGGETAGGSWNCAARPREDKAPLDKKTRWFIESTANVQ